MKLAVLGVGLMGGSVGLAARERLDAEVAGFDADPATAQRGVDLGVLDRAEASLEAACEEVDIVVCSAPVGALPELAERALAATGENTIVTDLGSTKSEIVARLGGVGRFIGGHPIAGAEASGVEHARADLFEGARWYLTPTTSTEGVLYDRLQRAVAGLGARPQAIEPEDHDRMLATVSHLPHVLANVLVNQAADVLAAGRERLPSVGPSFRDSARVAGANHGVWRDIFLSNRRSIVAEIDGVVERLGRVRELLEAEDGPGLERWIEGAREDRRRLLEDELAGARVYELRITVPNTPGVVARVALALGGGGVNIEDMALYPTPDGRAGAIALWVAGEEDARRAEELVAALDLQVTRTGERGR